MTVESDLSNHGKRWTEESKQLLITMIQQKKNISEIAHNLKRTPHGISQHLLLMGMRQMQQGQNIDLVCKNYHLDKSTFVEYLQKNLQSQRKQNESKGAVIKKRPGSGLESLSSTEPRKNPKTNTQIQCKLI